MLPFPDLGGSKLHLSFGGFLIWRPNTKTPKILNRAILAMHGGTLLLGNTQIGQDSGVGDLCGRSRRTFPATTGDQF